MSSGYRFFLASDSKTRVFVDSDASCAPFDCDEGVSSIWHSSRDSLGVAYAVRCPLSLSLEERARLRRADGTPIAPTSTPSAIAAS